MQPKTLRDEFAKKIIKSIQLNQLRFPNDFPDFFEKRITTDSALALRYALLVSKEREKGKE